MLQALKMKTTKFGFQWISSSQVCATTLLFFGVMACSGGEIQVYQTPKEHPSSAR